MLSSGLLSPSLSLYKYVSVYLGYLYIYLHIYMDCMYCIWIVFIYLLLLNTLACLLLSSVSMAFGLSSTGRLPNVTSRNVLRGCALQHFFVLYSVLWYPSKSNTMDNSLNVYYQQESGVNLLFIEPCNMPFNFHPWYTTHISTLRMWILVCYAPVHVDISTLHILVHYACGY